jgi:hypothetical protein
VSTLTTRRGAATPVRTVNLSMKSLSSGSIARGGRK